jgi:hypothetical protein
MQIFVKTRELPRRLPTATSRANTAFSYRQDHHARS